MRRKWIWLAFTVLSLFGAAIVLLVPREDEVERLLQRYGKVDRRDSNMAKVGGGGPESVVFSLHVEHVRAKESPLVKEMLAAGWHIERDEPLDNEAWVTSLRKGAEIRSFDYVQSMDNSVHYERLATPYERLARFWNERTSRKLH